MTTDSIAEASPQSNVSITGTGVSERPMPFRHQTVIDAVEAVVGRRTEDEKLATDLALSIANSSPGPAQDAMIGWYSKLMKKSARRRRKEAR